MCSLHFENSLCSRLAHLHFGGKIPINRREHRRIFSHILHYLLVTQRSFSDSYNSAQTKLGQMSQAHECSGCFGVPQI